ncbi:HTH domain-containing protein [Xenorhabdus sp. PB62.4]|uniref:HTH domain-containing protein n=1 Tax=Xenorhabdus sp. PB62.4 TaxID=1851573 RepID=UPI0034D017FE
METLVHHQQQAYYQVVRECDRTSDCTLFIDFMLEKLAEALRESLNAYQQDSVAMSVKTSVEMSVENLQPLNATSQKILSVIALHPAITITQLADGLSVSRRTIERNIKILQDNGYLVRVGAKKGGYWRVS